MARAVGKKCEFRYCPHCWPNGLSLTSSGEAPQIRLVYCEPYQALIDAQHERSRNAIMWKEFVNGTRNDPAGAGGSGI